MTVREAYKVHKRAARRVGQGKGYYDTPGISDALPVLEEFWATNGGGVYVTQEMVDKWDKEHATKA